MPKRVLLVDPDDHDRALAATVVERELPEVAVVQAATGTALATALTRSDFDVVVCEMEAGWVDGADLIASVRSARPSVAIVVLTRQDAAGAAVAALKAGAHDYLIKCSRAYLELPAAIARASERALEAERRRRAETRLQRLLDRSRLGVFRASLDGRLLEATPAFLSLLGVKTLEQALEIELPELHFSSQRAGEILGRVDERGELREREIELRRADGSRLWVNLTEVLLVDADGEVVIDGLVEDVSPLRRRIELLEARVRELESSVADLDGFASLVSHELQQPLRMMERYAQMLHEEYSGRLDSDADEYIGFAVDGARTMQRIIDDLRALTRVSTEGRALGVCDCEAALDRAIRASWQQIESTGARIQRGPMPKVLGDAGQLVQLLRNLLDNAMKFRGEDVPEIRISAERDEDRWVVSLSDNGIGIPVDQRKRVFEIFTRLHPEYEGSGVGLALCRRIVERHGGSIWVEDAPSGTGTTVRFTLPWQGAAEETAGSNEPVMVKRGG